MNIVRAVLAIGAAAVLWVVWATGQALLYMWVSTEYATAERIESTGNQVLWSAVPGLLGAFLAVLVAGLVYGRPRVLTVAGLVVVLVLPVGDLVVSTVLSAVRGAGVAVVLATVVAGVVGMAAGVWALAPRRRPAVSYE